MKNACYFNYSIFILPCYTYYNSVGKYDGISRRFRPGIPLRYGGCLGNAGIKKSRKSEVLMSCTVIIGSQWGDEGKAKMVDYFTRDSDIVVRYQGGANAGHTVVVGGDKYVFHLIPSGILHKNKICVIGNGVVLDPVQFMREVDTLEKQGLDVKKRILISDSLHLILPYHIDLDKAMEEIRVDKLGTTFRGIGPSYADKSLRIGIRAGEIFDEKVLKSTLELVLKIKNLQLEKMFDKPGYKADKVLRLLRNFRKRAGDMVQNTQYYLHKSLASGKKILLEGAQGYGLDVDHGTYPYVTSSNPTIGGALLGTGLNAFNINEVIGISKAYLTRVGEGPFPTEDNGADGDRLRVNGNEFGSTTGRPRRCGWFDVELIRQSSRINGFTSIALTKVDVLTGFKKIKVAVGYKMNGKTIDYFPTNNLHEAVPVYEELDGWKENIYKCKKYSELPKSTRQYIEFIEKKSGVPIKVISVGPDRMNTFKKE